MANTIKLNVDETTQKEIKSCEYIMVDDVIYVRKDYMIQMIDKFMIERKGSNDDTK